MKLNGDETGIAVLKEMHAGNNDYLKFLLKEAQTVFGNVAEFKSPDGTKYELSFNPQSGEFSVKKL